MHELETGGGWPLSVMPVHMFCLSHGQSWNETHICKLTRSIYLWPKWGYFFQFSFAGYKTIKYISNTTIKQMINQQISIQVHQNHWTNI